MSRRNTGPIRDDSAPPLLGPRIDGRERFDRGDDGGAEMVAD
jgi:hypothetical protein